MKNWVRPNSLLLSIMLLLIPCGLLAHGVKGKITAGTGATVVTARYSTNDVMSYAATTIRPPSGEMDFQTGRTDRNGRFCFFPDRDGDWEVTVDDGMGHRLKMTVPVGRDRSLTNDLEAASLDRNSPSLYANALSGLGIIFGVSGWLMWWRTRKIRQKEP
ncbi:conserved domain protein [delta proteobacterium NaphS2]|nr:conserved domain protein [delta proteobacterium NaphS2]